MIPDVQLRGHVWLRQPCRLRQKCNAKTKKYMTYNTCLPFHHYHGPHPATLCH